MMILSRQQEKENNKNNKNNGFRILLIKNKCNSLNDNIMLCKLLQLFFKRMAYYPYFINCQSTIN